MKMNVNIYKSYVKKLMLLLLLLFLGNSCVHKKKHLLWDMLTDDARTHFMFTHPESSPPTDEYAMPRDTLINLIDHAKVSIEIWCYEFDEPFLASALQHAQERGVKISFIGSQDQKDEYGVIEDAGIKIKLRAKQGLMHVKFVLIDRAVIFSGTGNLTTSDLFHNNNSYFTFAIDKISADQIAELLNYENDPADPVYLPYSGRMLASPRHGKLIQNSIIRAIFQAKHEIRYMIFSHTDPLISAALFIQAKRGILVQGIYNDQGGDGRLPSNSPAVLINKNLRGSPALIYIDGNRSRFYHHDGVIHGGNLHHKTMIIDSDFVITGSYNWSAGARDSNMELYYEFRDPSVVDLFIEEFNRVQSYALPLTRSLNVPDPVQSNLILNEVSGEYRFCWSNVQPEDGFVVFSGRGTFFRGEYFKPQKPKEGCINLSEREKISSSFASSSLFTMLPDTLNGTPSSALFSMDEYFQNPISNEELPCTNPCSAQHLEGGSIAQGWLWWSGDDTPHTMRVWGRAGFSQEIHLVDSGNHIYQFDNSGLSPSDALLFIKTDHNIWKLACFQSGGSIDAPLSHFIEEQKWAGGERPRCVTLPP